MLGCSCCRVPGRTNPAGAYRGPALAGRYHCYSDGVTPARCGRPPQPACAALTVPQHSPPPCRAALPRYRARWTLQRATWWTRCYHRAPPPHGTPRPPPPHPPTCIHTFTRPAHHPTPPPPLPRTRLPASVAPPPMAEVPVGYATSILHDERCHHTCRALLPVCHSPATRTRALLKLAPVDGTLAVIVDQYVDCALLWWWVYCRGSALPLTTPLLNAACRFLYPYRYPCQPAFYRATAYPRSYWLLVVSCCLATVCWFCCGTCPTGILRCARDFTYTRLRLLQHICAPLDVFATMARHHDAHRHAYTPLPTALCGIWLQPFSITLVADHYPFTTIPNMAEQRRRATINLPIGYCINRARTTGWFPIRRTS